MPLHPNFNELLQRLRARKASVATLPLQDARAYFEFFAPLCDTEPCAIAHMEDLELPVRGGATLAARLYCPVRPCWTEPQPVLLYFHSGGFVFGSLQTADAQCRALAVEAQCAVLSVAYRLAPEFRFPCAIDDAFDSLLWLTRNAHLLGLDPNRIAVGGESAGATLAAVTAINARNAEIPLAMQLLVYPGLSRRLDLESHTAYATGYYLTLETIEQMQSLYLLDERDRDDWRFAPLDAARQPDGGYAGLVPAVIVCAQYDPLIDEQFLYACKLRDAGNLVSICCYTGMIHGFFSMAGMVPHAGVARAEAGQLLTTAFDTMLELAGIGS
ncbi:alpha/beta hydrolase fold domain-containing protein [Paraburkholderia sp. CNPSo 3155]|uniref:alpha/beta hydrolase n=1 Tax=Paraburkholderia atlantica TaxID=2654982 RepID=UPI00128D900B|nr:alpha/beta hydrolase [Paraburkholderia atlantica]MPW11684.1 alpha/beta hydrolase fold domain-containing protein [Paraburkholderia atlantica]